MHKPIITFEYSDYRDFLYDWFWATKGVNKKLSFRFISMQLGLSSPNHFHLVVHKKRHLSQATFQKILRLVKPSTRERQFLKLLFSRDLEADPGKRAQLDEELELLRNQNGTRDLKDAQYQVVSNALAWYIKTGAIFFDRMTAAEIEKTIEKASNFPLRPGQVQYALDTLKASGFATLDGDFFVFDLDNVSTKWDLDRREIKSHHANNLRLALQSVTWPIDKRFFSSVTIPADGETYQELVQDIRNLCLKILDRSNKTINSKESCTSVVTLQFALFPFFEFAKE
jgi:uncharacterized protein (TIGR02147 family)